VDQGRVGDADKNLLGRRGLIAMLGGTALTWSGATWAAAPLPHIAFVAVGFGTDTTAFDAIRDALRTLGEVEGQTYIPEVHTTDDTMLLSQMAAEVVAANPTVIVTINATTAQEFLKLTQTIPIVVAFTGDPVALGFTQSVARPTRNVTGIVTLDDVLLWKKIELLEELVGRPLRRVGIMYDIANPSHGPLLAAAETRKGVTGAEVVLLGVTSGPDIADVLDRAEARHLDGLVVMDSPMIVTHRTELIAAETAGRLAAVHDFSFEVQDGALAAYGPEPTENFQRAAEYADRLLHGAKVADLPFDAPQTLHLSLNLKTARAIGLTVPQSLLVQADVVIE
jgi:ABC-type uncharacterized transport system substrate-binding protein